MKTFSNYLVLQLIPYGFWFVMGIGAFLIYLTAVDYRCRLDERSMSALQLRLLEEEIQTGAIPYGPQLPIDLSVRSDWLRDQVDGSITRFIVGGSD